MNILVIAPTPFYTHRGTPIRIFEQIKALASLGNNVDVITYHMGENPDFGVFNHQVHVYRIPPLFFWKRTLSAGPHAIKVFFDGLIFFLIMVRMMKKDYRVIHAYHHEGVVVGWLVKKIFFWRNMKLVGDFHGGFTSEMIMHGYGVKQWIVNIFKKIERMVYSLPDYCTTSSTLLQQMIQKNTSAPSECIADSIDVPLLAPRRNGQGVTIIYTGGFTQDKGIETLLEVLAHPDIFKSRENRVILAGSPAGMIQELVARHPYRDRIDVIDSPSEVLLNQLLEQATIALEPKPAQSFQSSGKLIRYIAKGLPVVLFDHSVNRYYLGNDYPYVTEHDSGVFAEQLLVFINNADLRSQAALLAYDRAQLFTGDKVRDALDAIYKKLCQS